MKIKKMTFDEFVTEYWPCNHGGSSYDGSEILWNGKCWVIKRVNYNCLDIANTGVLLNVCDPYKMFDALGALTDESSDKDVEWAVNSAKIPGGDCYFVNNPRESNYWTDFDGEYKNYDDTPNGFTGYVWHRDNCILTDESALEEWAEDFEKADDE